MAFKMKAGKEGPMQKNFPDLTGDGEVTQADILKGRGVFQMKKDNAPMMRMDNSAMKAMGKPAPVKIMSTIKEKAKKVKKGVSNILQKGDEFVEKIGDKYNKSKFGKFMAKLDEKVGG